MLPLNPEQLPVEEQVGRLLLSRGLTMGTAESCTGGRIAHLITSVPGSSAYFLGGVVSYSNSVKQEVLGVSTDSLEEWGAVSQQVVEQMVQGVQKLLHCDCAVATSGIAGPGGGTIDKPVGTVWMAVVYRGEVKSLLFHFEGDRKGIISQSAEKALALLLDMLQKEAF